MLYIHECFCVLSLRSIVGDYRSKSGKETSNTVCVKLGQMHCIVLCINDQDMSVSESVVMIETKCLVGKKIEL